MTSRKDFLILVGLLALLAIGVFFVFPPKLSRTIDLRVEYDAKSQSIFLELTNTSNQELLFDYFSGVVKGFSWWLCSSNAVVLEKSTEIVRDPHILADQFPTAIHPGHGRRINLSGFFPELENADLVAGADFFLWHWCLWDEISRQWIQEHGQIKLKASSKSVK
jgi:hypothetical protein